MTLLPKQPLIFAENLYNDDFVKFHFKYHKDTGMVMDSKKIDEIIEWAGECIQVNEYVQEIIHFSACRLFDPVILDKIKLLMPEDEYLVFDGRGKALYLKNNAILMKMVHKVINTAEFSFLWNATEIIGLNLRVFIWNAHNTEAWNIAYPKQPVPKEYTREQMKAKQDLKPDTIEDFLKRFN